MRNVQMRFVICVFDMLQYACFILHKCVTVKLDTFMQFVISDVCFPYAPLSGYIHQKYKSQITKC